MRTRSQQASPGGFVSLENEKTTRRTRSTRGASQSNASQSDPPQSTAESSATTQTATRSKPPRTAKKAAAPKKTSSTKTQSRKGTKRATRKTTHTQAASGDEEPESYNDQPAEHASVSNDAQPTQDPKDPESAPSSSKSVLSEPNTSELNRKRSRTDAGNAERAAPETPPANKRRNLGPPGSTPYRRTPLSRRLAASKAAPYSERLRRRAVEREGRIHTTIFRIPQLIAQNEADRRASESPSPSPFPEEPETTFDFTVERTEENESTPAEPTEPQQSSAPETPRRGWNIRGLLRSVPASLSITRFFPFNRSPGTTESTAPAQPSSERINRTQPPVADPSRSDARSRRLSEGHLNEEPPAKRARKLSYSLFPAPIDRSLYLGDITKSPTETPKETPKAAPKPSSSKAASRDAQKDTTPTPKPQEAIASTDKAKPVRGRASATTKTTDRVQKKRKRSPSPDVIPNPVGSSYGMDLDYFCYSSDSEDETKDQSSQSDVQESSKLPPAQAAVRSAIRSETHPSKKVRFDASPEDTPSKLRARSTDPYRGRHFIGMGHGSPSSTSASASAPATPTPSGHAPGFIPNRQGTFQLDYDAFSEDSESSAAPSPSTIPASSPTPSETPSVSSTQVEVGDKVPDSEQPAPLTPRVPSAPPSTPAANEEALQRARSQAEKYKPKTPSGLRATSRYSSPMVATPDTVVEQPQAETPEQFGNDQFARDAEWLYENCPSGDLKQLSWPAKRSLSESLGTSAAALKIMNDTLKQADIEEGYKIFRQGLQEFEKATA